ncbi:MAG: hypothetical protein LBP63_02690 [Prevotellaceae bacterium]|nr:hypothetical protein [Prevotellaceae bacterium]
MNNKIINKNILDCFVAPLLAMTRCVAGSSLRTRRVKQSRNNNKHNAGAKNFLSDNDKNNAGVGFARPEKQITNKNYV